MSRAMPASVLIQCGPVEDICNADHAARCGNLARKRDIMQVIGLLERHTNDRPSQCAGLIFELLP